MFHVKPRYLIAGLLALSLGSTGCGIMRAFVPDSARPNPAQLAVAKDLSETNVTTIAGLQSNKQENMQKVADKALDKIVSTTTDAQCEAIANITRNSLTAIRDADGTQKTLGKLQGATMEDVLRMPTAQFLAGIAAQTTADVSNKSELTALAKSGFAWGKAHTGMAIGLITMLSGLGVGAKVLSGTQSTLADTQALSGHKSTLLEGIVSHLMTFKAANPTVNTQALDTNLANLYASVPVNVPNLLGVQTPVV